MFDTEKARVYLTERLYNEWGEVYLTHRFSGSPLSAAADFPP